MARVKQVTLISVESKGASSPAKQSKEGEIPIVETKTALIEVRRLCILNVSENTMSIAVFIDLPLDGASSSSNFFRYGLGPAFFKETPPQMSHYFPIDLHGTPMFYSEAIDEGEWERKIESGSWYKPNRSWADLVDRMYSQR